MIPKIMRIHVNINQISKTKVIQYKRNIIIMKNKNAYMHFANQMVVFIMYLLNISLLV